MSGAAGDSIFALASGAAQGAVSLVRLSGSRAGVILSALCGGQLPAARRASVRSLRDAGGGLLDRAMVLWLPGPGTATGEDVVELHLHGGRAVLYAVSSALLSLGARPAEAGEFSRRAFLHGKMDLLEAEGIADLVAAETESQRVQALRQIQGAPGQVLADWAGRLTRWLAFQETLIDFPEEDLPASVEEEISTELRGLLAEMHTEVCKGERADRLRAGLVFAITGAPNVGKSSLLNALAGRDVAIVSPHAGTTRDSLEVPLDLGGVRVVLVDTAGLREAADPVEAEGVRRARAHAAAADLVVRVIDASALDVDVHQAGLTVANKIDLAAVPAGCIGVSVLTGEGLPALVAVLQSEAARLASGASDPVVTRARHVASLHDAAACIEAAVGCAVPELRAEELRLAVRALGRITGAVDTEDVLDVVFSSFCIGK